VSFSSHTAWLTVNSKLYSLINNEYDNIETKIVTCMDAIVNTASFGDGTSSNSSVISFGGILEVVVTLLREYVLISEFWEWMH